MKPRRLDMAPGADGHGVAHPTMLGSWIEEVDGSGSGFAQRRCKRRQDVLMMTGMGHFTRSRRATRRDRLPILLDVPLKIVHGVSPVTGGHSQHIRQAHMTGVKCPAHDQPLDPGVFQLAGCLHVCQ